ncbi:MAG: hydrogenase iron-sulfur subunit [Ardenticatenia bacterium]|nr:hydrogenase iron-sulfur subunit [Ardenticatenia bacterium]
MTRQIPLYTQRRFMRRLERGWAAVERALGRLTGTAFHPMYHLGTLAVILLVVLTVTGVYLTLFYRPGAGRAYETVAAMSASPLGSLMRTLHRYSADMLVVVVLLHALKMLVSDRFWGARWLAWVSGWVILLVVFMIGVMGYWLVWDDRAQWLTEFSVNLAGGQVALAFYRPGAVDRNFAFFVIILFLHVFLGVLLLGGLLVHVIRLSRPALFPPRWLTLQAVAVLIVLALLRPVSSGPPADFSRLVAHAEVDWLYLGFLPLASKYGVEVVLVGTFVVLGTILALPWLAKGRPVGVARITEHLCTGCALCALKCPYEAIEMVPRSGDATGFKALAVVTEPLCTGCGLCIGTCATSGVDLGPLSPVHLVDSVKAKLSQAAGEPPVLLLTCQRHALLSTLPDDWCPALVDADGNAAALPVAETTWRGETRSVPVLVLVLPCAGMASPDWLHTFLDAGAQATLVVSCPPDDCSFREGPAWLAENVRLRRRLLERPVFWAALAPGDRVGLERALAQAVAARPVPAASERLPQVALERARLRRLAVPSPKAMLSGLALLALTLLISIWPEQPVTLGLPLRAAVRVVMAHTPPLKTPARSSGDLQTTLPAGVSAEQILGGERYPVRLRLVVDGVTVLERTYQPSGLRREGAVTVVEQVALSPGRHRLAFWMMDDGETWRPMVDREVDVAPYDVVTLAFDEEAGRFVVYNPAEDIRPQGP